MGIFLLALLKKLRQFKDALVDAGIDFKERNIEVLQVEVNIEEIVEINRRGRYCSNANNKSLFPVISDESVERIDLSPGETLFSGYSDIMDTFISFKDSGGIELIGQTRKYTTYLI